MYCAAEEAPLGAQPDFDVEAMEERAGAAAAQDYNGFSWQQMMETGQQWRDYGYPEDQVCSCNCMETLNAWCASWMFLIPSSPPLPPPSPPVPTPLLISCGCTRLPCLLLAPLIFLAASPRSFLIYATLPLLL